MKILVEGIPSAGRDVTLGARDEWARVAAAEALDGPATVTGTIRLQRASTKGVVMVELAIEGRAAATCDRCGEATERLSRPAVTLLYAPEEKGSEAYDGGEIELEADDMDLGWYVDGELDLADVVREALALELSARTVCADSAACDKRTDSMLTASRPDDGSFAGLTGWKPGTGR